MWHTDVFFLFACFVKYEEDRSRCTAMHMARHKVQNNFICLFKLFKRLGGLFANIMLIMVIRTVY